MCLLLLIILIVAAVLVVRSKMTKQEEKEQPEAPGSTQEHPNPFKPNGPNFFKASKMKPGITGTPGCMFFLLLRPVWAKRIEV